MAGQWCPLLLARTELGADDRPDDRPSPTGLWPPPTPRPRPPGAVRAVALQRPAAKRTVVTSLRAEPPPPLKIQKAFCLSANGRLRTCLLLHTAGGTGGAMSCRSRRSCRRQPRPDHQLSRTPWRPQKVLWLGRAVRVVAPVVGRDARVCSRRLQALGRGSWEGLPQEL